MFLGEQGGFCFVSEENWLSRAEREKTRLTGLFPSMEKIKIKVFSQPRHPGKVGPAANVTTGWCQSLRDSTSSVPCEESKLKLNPIISSNGSTSLNRELDLKSPWFLFK